MIFWEFSDKTLSHQRIVLLQATWNRLNMERESLKSAKNART